MSDYALHPEAFADIDDIWEFIAQDNLERRIVSLRTSTKPSGLLSRCLIKGIVVPT